MNRFFSKLKTALPDRKIPDGGHLDEERVESFPFKYVIVTYFSYKQRNSDYIAIYFS